MPVLALASVVLILVRMVGIHLHYKQAKTISTHFKSGLAIYNDIKYYTDRQKRGRQHFNLSLYVC